MEWREDDIECLKKEVEELWKKLESFLEIDQDKSVVAETCFDIRRKSKATGRLYIREIKIKNILDEEFDTEITFEDRIKDKMLYKNLTREEAISDIIHTFGLTNKDIPTHIMLSNPVTYGKNKY